MEGNVKQTVVAWVTEHATDEELIQFASDIKARKERERKMVSELANFVGFNSVTGKSKVVAPVVSVVQPAKGPLFETADEVVKPVVAPVSLKTPPGQPASKIGKDTRDKIVSHLKNGPDTLGGISALIKRPQSATQALMSLLWSRKEVIFDGSSYKLRT